jgi:hypothetical protein
MANGKPTQQDDPQNKKLATVPEGAAEFSLTVRGNQPDQMVVRPHNLDELLANAKMIAFSNLVPEAFKGKPDDVAVAIQMGMEVGLHPMQAMQSIAVIRGRPCIWGEAVKALVLSSGLCEYWIDSPPDQIRETGVATCRTKRRGWPEESVYSFSVDDAKIAGLWGKEGPWKAYPARMLLARARGFLAKDTYPDVLRGMAVREEVDDLPEAGQFAAAEVIIPLQEPRRKSAAEASRETVTVQRVVPEEAINAEFHVKHAQAAEAEEAPPQKKTVPPKKQPEPKPALKVQEDPPPPPPDDDPQGEDQPPFDAPTTTKASVEKAQAAEAELGEQLNLLKGAAKPAAQPVAQEAKRAPAKATAWELTTTVQYAGKQIKTGGISAITLLKVQRGAERFDGIHYQGAATEALATMFPDDTPPGFEYLGEDAGREFLQYMKENEK